MIRFPEKNFQTYRGVEHILNKKLSMKSIPTSPLPSASQSKSNVCKAHGLTSTCKLDRNDAPMFYKSVKTRKIETQQNCGIKL